MGSRQKARGEKSKPTCLMNFNYKIDELTNEENNLFFLLVYRTKTMEILIINGTSNRQQISGGKVP